MALQFRPVGDAALLVEVEGPPGITPEVNAVVLQLDAALLRAGLAGVRETVPAYRTVLVLFDPEATDVARLSREIQALPLHAVDLAPARRWHLPVAYGGAQGPDLLEVARQTGLTPAEVVALHTAHDYRVYLLGFSPGFAYLGVLPPELRPPRRTTPRPRVPAGSVAIAGAQTGIYPTELPGGWHLLGRTPARLLDWQREPPILLQPGDLVRFQSVPLEELAALERTGWEPRPEVAP